TTEYKLSPEQREKLQPPYLSPSAAKKKDLKVIDNIDQREIKPKISFSLLVEGKQFVI
ncbi:unnamed protein product, partial [marine sediment metagenome]